MFYHKTIMVIEDNQDDFETISRVISEKDSSIGILRFENSDEASDYVETLLAISFSGQPITAPSIVLLDLNLSGLSGFNILGRLKSLSLLKKIPVVIFSNSDYIADISTAYNLGANSYVRKPLNYIEFDNTVKLLIGYWMEMSLLPKRIN